MSWAEPLALGRLRAGIHTQLLHIALDENRLSDAEAELEAAARLYGTNSAPAGLLTPSRATILQARGKLEAAHEAFLQSERELAAQGRTWHAALARGCAGIVRLELGDPRQAARSLRAAIGVLGKDRSGRYARIFRAYVAAALAQCSELTDACAHLDQARAPGLAEGSVAERVIHALAAAVELQRASAALAEHEVPRAQAHQASAAELAWGARDGASTSVDVRIALRYLDNLQAHLSAKGRLPSTEPTVVVARNGRWLRVSGTVVSLTRRRVLARMLAALAQARDDRPGEALSHTELIESTWPGEILTDQSALERLHATVKRLRREGLGEMLQSADLGFRLSSEVVISHLERPPE